MIKAKIKKSFLVISPPPFGGKHSTVKVFLNKLYQNICSLSIFLLNLIREKMVKTIGGMYEATGE